VLVRLDHIASVIANANHAIGCWFLRADEKLDAFSLPQIRLIRYFLMTWSG